MATEGADAEAVADALAVSVGKSLCVCTSIHLALAIGDEADADEIEDDLTSGDASAVAEALSTGGSTTVRLKRRWQISDMKRAS